MNNQHIIGSDCEAISMKGENGEDNCTNELDISLQGFATRFVEARRSIGMDVKTLADKIGVTEQTVEMWESAECYPEVKILPVIAKVLYTDVDFLLAGVIPDDKMIANLKIQQEDIELSQNYDEDEQDAPDEDGQLGLRISLIRHEKALSVAEFANMLSVDKAQIDRWESGEETPDTEKLDQIASALDVTRQFLLTGKADTAEVKKYLRRNRLSRMMDLGATGLKDMRYAHLNWSVGPALASVILEPIIFIVCGFLLGDMKDPEFVAIWAVLGSVMWLLTIIAFAACLVFYKQKKKQYDEYMKEVEKFETADDLDIKSDKK